MKHVEFQNQIKAIPNLELAEMTQSALSKLCSSGGGSFTMTVPPRLDDTDIILSEIITRFELLHLEAVQNFSKTANNYDNMLSVVFKAISIDAQIKALNERMYDLYKYSTPKYVMQTNGEINAVNSKEFDEMAAKILEQIELRQQQIISDYTLQ